MMEQSMRKPLNWQDFESLCKKLWGEIWKVPTTIKKNGRLGQSQLGVDIYGIPEGKNGYWGIQCKGKNDYSDAKISEKEIDHEITEALNFKPALEVLIIATSANKDAVIEQYVREKDLESRRSGGFQILLFCWEDIVDLIENNQETFNYYVKGQKFNRTHSLKVWFNEWDDFCVLRPTFVRTIRQYKFVEANEVNDFTRLFGKSPVFNPLPNIFLPGAPSKNMAKCKFDIVIDNDGSSVIENWFFKVEFEGGIKSISDEESSGGLAMINTKFILPTYVKGNAITYYPKDEEPLIQKNNRWFSVFLEPEPEAIELTMKWEILARDFNDQGTVTIKVEPIFEDVYQIEEVHSVEEVLEDEVILILPKITMID